MVLCLSFALLLLAIPALAWPTATTSCDLSNAILSVPSNQIALVQPTSAPSFVTLGLGVQNYTCDPTSQTYLNVGAVAELFDISCFYGTLAFSSIQDDMYTIWSQAPPDFTTEQFISALGKRPIVLGQHYYVPNPQPTMGSPVVSPKWDFTSDAEQGNPEAFVIGAKVGDIPAPTGSNNIDWVQLRNVEGQLADTVYRVDTKGGQPPASCTVDAPLLTVRYTAKYWLFGGAY